MVNLKTGQRGNYRWAEIWGSRAFLHDLIKKCPGLVFGKIVVVVSFDSGPLVPTPEEQSEGWKVLGSLAVSPTITDPSMLPTDQYDEWYVFPDLPTVESIQPFINYCDFSFQSDGNSNKPQTIRTEEFWSQLIRHGPESYLAEGDRLFVATTDQQRFSETIRFMEGLGGYGS